MLPPQLLPLHLQSLLPQPLLLLQPLPPSMVDTLLLPLPMADMLALDTLVLLPPLVLDSQPPLMLLDNSTQLPSPTSMMPLEMLAVMLPLLLRPTSTMPLAMLVAMMMLPRPLLPLSMSTRRSPLRSMCMMHLARPIQQLSPTSTLSPLLQPSPLLPQPSLPPQPLLLPLPSELSDMELDTEPDME